MNNAQKSNVFTQFADWRADRVKSLTEAEVGKAASARSDKTNADEAKIWISFILAVATVITSFLAMMYYQDVFLHSFSSTFAWVLAAALAVSVEIGKIKLLLRALHSVLFSWMFRSWASLGYWSFIWLMAGGAFFWSIRVSTHGLTIFSKNHSEETVSKDSLTPLLASATADINRQINAEMASRTDAQNNKWKGTTVYVSSKQAKANTANITALQAQKDAIISQTIADYKAGLQQRGEKINGFTAFIQEFGGYMEAVAFLCVMAIAFFNRRLVDVAIEQAALPEQEQQPAPYPTTTQNGHNNSVPRHNQNGHAIQNRYPGFNVDQTGNVIPTQPSNPAPMLYHSVPQVNQPEKAIGADSIIQHNQSRINAELSNLKTGNGNANTVTRRIYDKIEAIGRGMQANDFKPSGKVATECYVFMREKVFPVLLEHGKRYEYEDAFMTMLVKHVDANIMAQLVA